MASNRQETDTRQQTDKRQHGEILVIEDNPASLKLLVAILTEAGFKVRPAGDGELGLRSVQVKKPDLILLDFKLPGSNGVEVCERLKADPATQYIPIIFISAMEDSELKVKALHAGAVDYVTKPIKTAEVLARIETHLSMSRLQKETAQQAAELDTHRQHLENLVAERTKKLAASEAKIAASLREKDVLLREIHHRVKNNMQVIVSLLRLHSRRTQDEHVRLVFGECRDRINAMSLIHEALYESEDIARIDFHAYLEKLCRYLNRAYSTTGHDIQISLVHSQAWLGMDQSVAVGMVVCELVSNAFKHAFTEDRPGTIAIELAQLAGKEIQLTIQDNGVGLPAEIDLDSPPSLGLDLAVSAVRGELGGTIDVTRAPGTKYVIRFDCADIGGKET